MDDKPTPVPPDIRQRNQAGQFAPGVSGNPSGRPRGNRSFLHRALDDLAGSDAEDVLRMIVERAKAAFQHSGIRSLEFT